MEERTLASEGGRDVGRDVVEDFANVDDWDANEVDSSPISAEEKEKGVALLGLGGELLVATRVHPNPALEEENFYGYVPIRTEHLTFTHFTKCAGDY